MEQILQLADPQFSLLTTNCSVLILINTLSLSIQLLQFQQFKDRTVEIYKQDKDQWRRSCLSKPQDFSKALYTLDCGQNDLHFGLISMVDEHKVVESNPNIINQFALAIKVN